MAPQFETMVAGVAMEREGEAAGGRVAAAHLELCVVVGSAPRLRIFVYSRLLK